MKVRGVSFNCYSYLLLGTSRKISCTISSLTAQECNYRGAVHMTEAKFSAFFFILEGMSARAANVSGVAWTSARESIAIVIVHAWCFAAYTASTHTRDTYNSGTGFELIPVCLMLVELHTLGSREAHTNTAAAVREFLPAHLNYDNAIEGISPGYLA